MRLFLIGCAAAVTLAAQILPPQPQPTPAVATSDMPDYAVGVGTAWNRGASSNPYSVDTSIAIHLGKTSQWYSWTNISTPVVAPTSASPVASTITTGLGWIPIRSANGHVSLVFLLQGGITTVQASSVSPSFTGSLGVDFRLSQAVHVMPFVRAANATTGSGGALATAVMQPGVQLFYTFGGK